MGCYAETRGSVVINRSYGAKRALVALLQAVGQRKPYEERAFAMAHPEYAATASRLFLDPYEPEYVTVEPIEHEGQAAYRVTVDYAQQSSYGYALAVDEACQDLGAFALTSSFFESVCDGEREELYVGPIEQLGAARLAELKALIGMYQRDLTAAQLQELVDQLNDVIAEEQGL